MDPHADASIKDETFPLAHAIQALPTFVNLLPPVLVYLGGFLGPLAAIAGFVPRHHSHLIKRSWESVVVPRRSFENSTADRSVTVTE